MELRKARRYRLSEPVSYCWERADGTLQEAQAITHDISDRGVFILAKELPLPGARIELDVHLHGVTGTSRSAQLHGEGTVVRTSGRGTEVSGFAATVIFHTENSDTAPVLGPERIQ
jgi:hypothetical protein